MKERIEKIMEREGMTPTKFAEEIGIQRSRLSHILTGRNNASLDVVTKILKRFNYVNPDWLHSGRGVMCQQEKMVAQPSLFVDENDDFVPEDTVREEYPKENEFKTPTPTPKQPEKEQIIIRNLPNRKVMQILLFYSDSTYDTFIPQKEEG